MNKKLLFVSSIKPLANGTAKNEKGELVDSSSRFSLKENGEHFCIAVVQFVNGKPDDARVAEILALKGKEVIAIERAIDTADGTAVNQWYLLTEEDVETYTNREVRRDVNTMIATKKDVAVAKAKADLATAMKAAGAPAFVA